MTTPIPIKLLNDGREVHGLITCRDRRFIAVEIIYPFQNLSTSLNIPWFALEVHSFEGEYGIERGLDLLVHLYKLGSYLHAHLPELRERFPSVQERIGELERVTITAEEFLTQRRVLRSQFKKGRIDQREYEKKLRFWRKGRDYVEFLIDEIQTEFIDKNFPMSASWEQVSAILAGQKDLW